MPRSVRSETHAHAAVGAEPDHAAVSEKLLRRGVARILLSVAVTQQLARVTEAMLDECRVDVRRLDDLCSWRALESTEYLDLDWAPSLLEGAAMAAQVGNDLVTALRLSTIGDTEVNPDYRDVPDTVWEHPVSFLTTSDVVKVDRALQALESGGFLTERSVRSALAGQPPDGRPADPVGYLSGHFHALRGFYREAAGRVCAPSCGGTEVHGHAADRARSCR